MTKVFLSEDISNQLIPSRKTETDRARAAQRLLYSTAFTLQVLRSEKGFLRSHVIIVQ